MLRGLFRKPSSHSPFALNPKPYVSKTRQSRSEPWLNLESSAQTLSPPKTTTFKPKSSQTIPKSSTTYLSVKPRTLFFEAQSPVRLEPTSPPPQKFKFPKALNLKILDTQTLKSLNPETRLRKRKAHAARASGAWKAAVPQVCPAFRLKAIGVLGILGV